MRRGLTLAFITLSLEALFIPATVSTAHSEILYTFNYGPTGSYNGASITYSGSSVVDTIGQSLTYVGGSVNGCAPASIGVAAANVFGTAFDTPGCAAGGTDVGGLYFIVNPSVPTTTGGFPTDLAGRMVSSGGGVSFIYADGSVVIADTDEAYLYTFAYGPDSPYGAGSITYLSNGIFSGFGQTLSYVGGDINGCAPTTLNFVDFSAVGSGFGDPACGDGAGPLVDGLRFQFQAGLPTGPGSFATDLAGRIVSDGNGASFHYTDGTLTIAAVNDQTFAVPTPASAGLLLAGLAGLGLARRRGGRTRPAATHAVNEGFT